MNLATGGTAEVSVNFYLPLMSLAYFMISSFKMLLSIMAPNYSKIGHKAPYCSWCSSFVTDKLRLIRSSIRELQKMLKLWLQNRRGHSDVLSFTYSL